MTDHHPDYASVSRHIITDNGVRHPSPLIHVTCDSPAIDYEDEYQYSDSSRELTGEESISRSNSKDSNTSPRSLTDLIDEKGDHDRQSNGSSAYRKTSAARQFKVRRSSSSSSRASPRVKRPVRLERNSSNGSFSSRQRNGSNGSFSGQHRRRRSDGSSASRAMSFEYRDEEVPFGTKLSSPPSIQRDTSTERRIPMIRRQSFSEKSQNEHAPLLSPSTTSRERKERSPSAIRKAYSQQQNIAQMIREVKGVEQPLACRDVFFGILFCAQLLGILVLGHKFAREAISSLAIFPKGNVFERTGSIVFTFQNLIYLAICGGITTMTISSVAFGLMMKFSRRFVSLALWTAIALSLLWTLIGVAFSPKTFIPLTGIVSVGFTTAYSYVVWDRIPFARANLNTALTAIRSNKWIFCIGLTFQMLTLTLSVFYAFTGIGIYDRLAEKDVTRWETQKHFILFGLFLSYYWSFRVLVHIVHVTVAGIVHDWWFSKDETVSIWPSFVRAFYYSFGSVCLGSSLFVGVMRILRQLISFIRRRDFILNSGSFLDRFLVSCISFIDSKTNHWAFSYVGMYGYGFLEASKRANSLFQKRGWKKIVADDLVGNILILVALVIAGMTGSILTIIEDFEHLHLSSFERPTRTAFVLGIGTGMVLSILLFGIILSAVNTVIVSFAGSPQKLLVNHPELYVEMRVAWLDVWPRFVDNIEEHDTPSRFANRGWRQNMRETSRMDLGLLV